MQYDVVIVGAGPAGLSAAIRLKQLAIEGGRNISVCVLDKHSEVGAHILSGAVMDPRAITELFPNWNELGAPLSVPVTECRLLFLTGSEMYRNPERMLPDRYQNHGNYVVSLGHVVRWLGRQAEALGVEICPGVAAADVLYHDDGSVKGVATGNLGVDRHGPSTSSFQPGVQWHAKYTLFSEGACDHLGKQLMAKYDPNRDCDSQADAIGIKELWEVAPKLHQPGLVVHTTGWPLKSDTYGGSFLYHMDNHQVAVGYVVWLAHQSSYLLPCEAFERYKTHPAIRPLFDGGRRLSYGARAIATGAMQLLPKLIFPGGVLIGRDAGFLNASRIKGRHTAIHSGKRVADAAYAAVAENRCKNVYASSTFNEETNYAA